ncbi:MAG: hypothetical protein FWF59_05925 [Turicibacter sp.]|nr:hypothetical protein [Turicibacter sp.]
MFKVKVAPAKQPKKWQWLELPCDDLKQKLNAITGNEETGEQDGYIILETDCPFQLSPYDDLTWVNQATAAIMDALNYMTLEQARCALKTIDISDFMRQYKELKFIPAKDYYELAQVVLSAAAFEMLNTYTHHFNYDACGREIAVRNNFVKVPYYFVGGFRL